MLKLKFYVLFLTMKMKNKKKTLFLNLKKNHPVFKY